MRYLNKNFTTLLFLFFFFGTYTLLAQPSNTKIVEEHRSLKTYPFSDPNPIPILTNNPKIYPYFKYEGYSKESAPQDHKIVKLENDYIEVYVMPEAGGKVWGAIEKSTGEEFIYRNEVAKFRNISMRGPWTSGGIEFNFGIIGHHPSTATPVDYIIQEHEDGSATCVVGNIDLPSRTQWRVKIHLPKDKAFFETNAVWYNPTPLNQAYYNWMTAAAFATSDLEFYTPGDQYLKHSGEAVPWPYDKGNRQLSLYKENNFGSSKSYHVVGEYNDFFGGYFHDSNYGFGHWSEYEEIPGQKLWLWALSRSGGIWEDLLTDTDGQYIEFQAGRLFVQYSAGAHINPVTEANFPPHTTDNWQEIWFPVKEIGGMNDVSPSGVMNVTTKDGNLSIGINALEQANGTLKVFGDDNLLHSEKLKLEPMDVFSKEIALKGAKHYQVTVEEMDLSYSSQPINQLKRPFETIPQRKTTPSSAELLYREGMEFFKVRAFPTAIKKFQTCLEKEPFHLDAHVSLAEIYYRRGEYQKAIDLGLEALKLDTYHGGANFVCGAIFRAMDDLVNAKEALGWAARSMEFRSAAYTQMAEIYLQEKAFEQAAKYAQKALDFNVYNISAWQVLATTSRKINETKVAQNAIAKILEIDPLNHFAYFEQYLLGNDSKDLAIFQSMHRSELPDQTLLELAIDYHNKGLNTEALDILQSTGINANPLFNLWQAYLIQDQNLRKSDQYLTQVLEQNPDFVFPFRRETLKVLEWANTKKDHWKLKYYLSLNYWGKDRLAEAGSLMKKCGDEPEYGYFYMSRADLLQKLEDKDPIQDLTKAYEIIPTDWRIPHAIYQYHSQKNQQKEALKIAIFRFVSTFFHKRARFC